MDSSIKLLQDITGQPVECFRALGFSIREQEAWAFDILSELGIKYDCSVFPAHHAHGGMAGYAEAYHEDENENLRHEMLRNESGNRKKEGIGPAIIKHGDAEIKEFPVTIKKIAGKNLIFSGGGYFRLFPYPLIKAWSKEAEENGYLLSYIHPRDLDGGQPMLEGLPLARKFKSYVGTKGAAKKLEQYLTDFRFTDVQTAASQIAWDKVPVVKV